MKIRGGHALMLGVRFGDEAEQAIEAFVAQSSANSRKGRPHVTLAFIGRDLDYSVGEKLKQTSKVVALASPRQLTLSVVFSLFGYRHDHLVARVSTHELEMALNVTGNELDAYAIHRQMAINPHVTLAIVNPRHGRPFEEALRDPILRPIRGATVDVTGVIAKIGDEYHEEKL